LLQLELERVLRLVLVRVLGRAPLLVQVREQVQEQP
jgi:hypothetical protein